MSEVFNKSGDSAMPVPVTAGQRNKLNIRPYLFALYDLRAGPDPALSPICCIASIRDPCTTTSFFNNLIHLTDQLGFSSNWVIAAQERGLLLKAINAIYKVKTTTSAPAHVKSALLAS
ncbi:hypothetical protein FNYG_09552 [Fusarium nygamai]|uniref:Uncharacterized protein n=1 Tax=Gibberella nygamai TaxID=42673 RepID=A0A2K0W4Q3_GIBNY|nr:hypothetical protein FNYG_09552 [Fusarium nygamai]